MSFRLKPAQVRTKGPCSIHTSALTETDKTDIINTITIRPLKNLFPFVSFCMQIPLYFLFLGHRKHQRTTAEMLTVMVIARNIAMATTGIVFAVLNRKSA